MTDLKKKLSTEHEKYIAKICKGKRTRNSGALITEKGDVLSADYLIDCKMTGEPGKPAKSISVKIKDWEKIWQEALEVNKLPALALRIYNPDSPNANHNGYIDFILTIPEIYGS